MKKFEAVTSIDHHYVVLIICSSKAKRTKLFYNCINRDASVCVTFDSLYTLRRSDAPSTVSLHFQENVYYQTFIKKINDNDLFFLFLIIFPNNGAFLQI